MYQDCSSLKASFVNESGDLWEKLTQFLLWRVTGDDTQILLVLRRGGRRAIKLFNPFALKLIGDMFFP